jgi:hypothetical protein
MERMMESPKLDDDEYKVRLWCFSYAESVYGSTSEIDVARAELIASFILGEDTDAALAKWLERWNKFNPPVEAPKAPEQPKRRSWFK